MSTMFSKGVDEIINDDFMIVFKQGSLEIIKKAKGWKTDAELARNMHFTRQYICALKKRKIKCSDEVIIRVAVILGDTNGKWWNHFEMVNVGKHNPNHQKFNQLKHEGKQPYTKHSVMGLMRSQDNLVEFAE